jgi:hypothetical protein
MFNVGDEIVWVGTDGPRFSHGRIYVVLYADSAQFIVRENTGRDVARSQTGVETQYWALHRLKTKPKVKLPPPKDDIEWMNRVQQNFKE